MNPSDVRLDAHGFPIAPDFAPRAVEEFAPKLRRAGRGTFTIRALLVMLAVGAAIMALVRAELGVPLGNAVARWLAGHAFQKQMADDLNGALRDLDRALSWNDKSERLFAQRGQVRLEMGDLEGSLNDFSKGAALAPEWSGALELRAMSLQRLDRHEEAIRDVTKAIQLHRFEPHLLNSRAYTRAIAGVELNEALQDIQSAIEIEGRNSHYLDTRGYIYFLLGEYEPALADLDQALAMARREAPNSFILDPHPYPELVLARLKRQHENILAVMYHHRGLIHQKLGHSELADSDLRQGQAFGYNPDAGIY